MYLDVDFSLLDCFCWLVIDCDGFIVMVGMFVDFVWD